MNIELKRKRYFHILLLKDAKFNPVINLDGCCKISVVYT